MVVKERVCSKLVMIEHISTNSMSLIHLRKVGHLKYFMSLAYMSVFKFDNDPF